MKANSPTRPPGRGPAWVAGVGLLLLSAAAYHNSLQGPFVFDDEPAIVANPSIRRLWPLGDVLWPELADGGITVSGRPLVNLSLAVNHAIGGQSVTGYHFFNLAVHALAGLVLFGLVRRTLTSLPSRLLQESEALPLAWSVTALWLVHPLQTAAVTYVVQRAEVMMGLCYLLTLYCFIRAEQKPETGNPKPEGGARGATSAVTDRRCSRQRRLWLSLSVAACLAGMGCKEVMVTAPLMVLLYDRTFVAGSFAQAWRLRRGYYLALACTWGPLLWLVAGTEGRGGTAGFGTAVSGWTYALTQAGAVVRYLGLSVWPARLVFDYGTDTVAGVAEVWSQLLVVAGLVAATGWALVRRPVWGFVGAWFLVVLAPSSSVVPVASQTMAEHRMYLSLLAPMLVVVAILHRGLGRRVWVAGLVGALVLGGLTLRRNEVYRSPVTLWADTVAKQPANARAHLNLGRAKAADGEPEAALLHYDEAARLQPDAPEPHYNKGLALARLNRLPEALASYEEALRRQPGHAGTLNNRGIALLRLGRMDEAAAGFEAALREQPRLADAHSNLAHVRLEQGRIDEAIRHGEEALRLDPEHDGAAYNLGNALVAAGRLAAARAAYEQALVSDPDDADAANNLGNVLLELDRPEEAVRRYAQAVRARPDLVAPRRALVAVLPHLGRVAEAVEHARVLVRLRPGDPAVAAELERLERRAGR